MEPAALSEYYGCECNSTYDSFLWSVYSETFLSSYICFVIYSATVDIDMFIDFLMDKSPSIRIGTATKNRGELLVKSFVKIEK